MKLTPQASLAAVATIFILCGIYFLLPILQIGSSGGFLSQLYHPDPVPNIAHLRFSPDESKIAFNICSPCRIAICSVANEETVILRPPKGSTIYDVAFDPKSNKVAFILSRTLPNGNSDYQVAVSNIDGSHLKIVTSSDTRKRFPAYSFDGSKILFEAKERCLKEPKHYCAADLYEYDFDTRLEKRLTDLQALQVGPASLFPGNKKIILTAYGSTYSRDKGYAHRIEDRVHGEQRIFVLDIDKPSQLEPLSTNTPTASSPQLLPSGTIAFQSRVNEYDNVKVGYVYDVFLWSQTGSRRLTNFSRYIREYEISNNAQSVAVVTEAKGTTTTKAELLLWSAANGSIRKLHCGSSVEERPFVP